jgi:hypothetical protein
VREGVGWAAGGVFEGGDGRGDDRGPFGIGVAGCWGHDCCLLLFIFLFFS